MNQSKLPGYILKRGGTFYVRISVPKDLRHSLGKIELKRSLNTKNRSEAALLAPPAIANFQRQIEEARSQCTSVHKMVSEVSPHDAKELARARLLNMQASADQSRVRGQHIRAIAGDATDRSQRLADNGAFLEFLTSIQTEPSWRSWRTAMGRSARQAYAAEHGVVIEPNSAAHDLLSEFGAQAQVEHARRAIHRDTHPYEVIAAPDSGKVFGEGQPNLTLDQLLKAYRTDKEQTWKRSSGEAFRKAERVLRAWFGTERAITSLSRAEFKELFRTITLLPRSYSQSAIYRGMSLQQVIEKAASMEISPPRLSEKSCKDYVVHIKSVFNWASREEYLVKSPASGALVIRQGQTTVSRRKFEPSELRILFTAGIYAEEAQERSGAAFWLPLIAAFTGMRSGEIAQLKPGHIEPVDGVLCIRLIDAGELKTQVSVRDIPVHSELERLGFVRFVESRARDGSDCLFPDLPLNAKKDRSSQFSKTFRKMLAEIGLDGRGLCMHSFRHTVTNRLATNDTPAPIVEALLGWGKRGRTMYQHYAGRPPMRQLADAVASISYEGVDLQHLYTCTTQQPQPAQRRQFD